jgi:GABA(A) receptor-associated protein
MVEDPSRKAHLAMVKHPDKVPVYIKVADEEKSVPDLDRHCYLINRDMTVGQVVYIIRKRIKLSSKMAIFVFVDNGILPPTSALIGEVYSEHRDPIDALLYVTYRAEKTFG